MSKLILNIEQFSQIFTEPLTTRILNFNNIKVDASIISFTHIKNLVDLLIEIIISNKVEGDVVEFGCYVGESTKYLMKTLVETNSNKKLYVYDSFEGLPDLSKWEENTGWRPRTLNVSREVIEENFNRNNLPVPFITKGWFRDIPPQNIPEKISFAFLDGDFYDSIYDSLIKIYDRVEPDGYIIFHDYNRPDLPGVKAAVDQFFTERQLKNTTKEIVEQLGVYKKIV